MQEEKEIFSCPVEATLSLIGGKYKPLILWHLIEQPLHYMELQRLIPKATAKMLSQQLRDLQQSENSAMAVDALFLCQGIGGEACDK